MGSEFLIQQLRQFIFMLANNGHWVFLGTLGIGVFGLGPIGRALAARIRGPAADQASLDALKAGIADLQERLDFSERVLTELRQRALGPGDGAPQPAPGRTITSV